MSLLLNICLISCIDDFYECLRNIHDHIFCHDVFVCVNNDELAFRKQKRVF